MTHSNLSKELNELLVLSVLLERPAHGYQIGLMVEEQSGGSFEFQHGTLYPILHRLEAEGLIDGSWDGGGGRRKTYRITPDGIERQARGRERLRELFETVGRMAGWGQGAA